MTKKRAHKNYILNPGEVIRALNDKNKGLVKYTLKRCISQNLMALFSSTGYSQVVGKYCCELSSVCNFVMHSPPLFKLNIKTPKRKHVDLNKNYLSFCNEKKRESSQPTKKVRLISLYYFTSAIQVMWTGGARHCDALWPASPEQNVLLQHQYIPSGVSTYFP